MQLRQPRIVSCQVRTHLPRLRNTWISQSLSCLLRLFQTITDNPFFLQFIVFVKLFPTDEYTIIYAYFTSIVIILFLDFYKEMTFDYIIEYFPTETVFQNQRKIIAVAGSPVAIIREPSLYKIYNLVQRLFLKKIWYIQTICIERYYSTGLCRGAITK